MTVFLDVVYLLLLSVVRAVFLSVHISSDYLHNVFKYASVLMSRVALDKSYASLSLWLLVDLRLNLRILNRTSRSALLKFSL